MPLIKCQQNGKKGWKYGPNGTCYIGKTGKKRAIRQMKAMYANGYQGPKK